MIAVRQENGVHSITLNQPLIGNSLSDGMVAALHDALDQMARQDGRLLVLRGEGRHFCTGFHLGDLESESDGSLLLRFVRIEQLLARIWTAPFPTLAIAQGCAFGAGADLFVACRRRVAIEGARFRFPGAGFGLVLGTRRLAERVGGDTACGWIAGGVTVDAPTAVSRGLATDLASADMIDAIMAQEVAAASRLHPATMAAICAASRNETVHADQDLAALVRSAACPGLKDRIAAYLAELSKG
ncbi:enoyl-CoA hydratase/isomerase family protein [Sphingobium amiense]|uniref:Enoyl-CoA hydratase/isomerase family protein n=1 Tax=Sphingobium amiense TaxID=135719 RepID=A0A494W8P5_9SPHN|nr:enoyl-CoA hydratase/isomerase family protein [Sphingobium amiense]BBD96795.1 enoyl-CoA hydratase/isomerase family protein [Sphingobium amiense]